MLSRVYDTYNGTMVKCVVYITCKQKANCGDEKTKTRCVLWPLGKLAGYDLGRSSKVGCGDCATINDYR